MTMDTKLSSAVRFYRHETGDYLIRDLCTLGGRFVGCEYGVAMGDSGLISWTSCPEGAEFAKIQPVMPKPAGASGTTRGSGASAGVTMAEGSKIYEVVENTTAGQRTRRVRADGIAMEAGHLRLSIARDAASTIALYAPSAWASVSEIEHVTDAARSYLDSVAAANDLMAQHPQVFR